MTDQVYAEMRVNVKDRVIALTVDHEREGEQIDGALLMSVLGIIVDIGMGTPMPTRPILEHSCFDTQVQEGFFVDSRGIVSLNFGAFGSVTTIVGFVAHSFLNP